MALVRLGLKNLGQGLVSTPSSASSILVSQRLAERSLGGTVQKQQRWGSQLLRGLSTGAAAGDKKSEGRGGQGAVSDPEPEGRRGKKFSLFPRRRKQRQWGLWRKNSRGDDFFPALNGLGDALMQATENINRLFENLGIKGRVKEEEESYKLRFDVPGLSKEDVKIIVEDGVLTIKGEHKEEGDDENWSYGYYHTSLVLPDDAKTDAIKAQMKDGVLILTIPRTETPKKEVKEVPIQ